MLDSAPPAELAADRYGHYQIKYQDDEGLVMAALLDGQARKGTVSNTYGKFQSFLQPIKQANGSYYLVGADVDAWLIELLINQARWRALWLGLLLFVVSSVVCLFVAHHFSAPLTTFSSSQSDLDGRSEKPHDRDQILLGLQRQ